MRHVAAIALLALLLPASAGAQDMRTMNFECEGNYQTTVSVDGLQFDWEDEIEDTERVMGLATGEQFYDWTGGDDSSFKVWCRYNEHGLYFAVIARDNEIVAPEGRRDGDRFEIWMRIDDETVPEDERFFAISFPVWPVHDDGASMPSWRFGRSGEVTASRGEVALRPDKGFFMEMSIPYLALDNVEIGFAPIGFAAVYRDWDYDADLEQMVSVASAPINQDDDEALGRMTFTGVDERVRQITDSLGANPDDLALSTWADITGDARQEYVFLVDGQLVLTGVGLDGYDWAAANARFSETDQPLELFTRDITADGKDEIFYRYRRTRQSIDTDLQMHQEFVAAYGVNGQQVDLLFQQEVANEIPGVGRIESEMMFRDRGHYRTLVRFFRAEGDLTSDQWEDIDAHDRIEYGEMIVPWRNQRRLNWGLEGDRWIIIEE